MGAGAGGGMRGREWGVQSDIFLQPWEMPTKNRGGIYSELNPAAGNEDS